MGTAPEPRQHPAMPSPKRVVRRSLTMLRSLGYPDVVGLVMIRYVAREAGKQLAEAGFADLDWLDEVAMLAQERLDGSHPSDTDSEDTDHGDGPSSTAGSTARQ